MKIHHIGILALCLFLASGPAQARVASIDRVGRADASLSAAGPQGSARPALARTTTAGAKAASTVKISRPKNTGVSARRVPRQPAGPIHAVTGVAVGQSGYVHYFVITRPDGVLETQVGIELPDQQIAWSFREAGVALSPFIDHGTVTVNERVYEVQHLYGVRPFSDDRAMRELQDTLPQRVFPWIDHAVEYCELGAPPRELCVSCLGFVLRILFPGHFPGMPALPADFKPAGSGEHYTTEDLLVYLTALDRQPTAEARLKRLQDAALPESMREELYRLVSAMNENPAEKTIGPRPLIGKNRLGRRSVQQRRL